MGRIELEFPTSAGMRSMGIRPSAYVDVGSLWKLKSPTLTDYGAICTLTTDNVVTDTDVVDPGEPCATGYTRSNGYKEVFLGNSPRPRVSVGVGVNWVSPFGPLRLDIAKAILHQKGDDTKLFSFNVGTQF